MNEVLLTFVESIIPVALCVALPVLIVWLVMRVRINETNRRSEVLLAAIERKDNVDIDALTKLLSRKTPQEKLQSKLTYGCVFSCLAVAIGLFLAIAACLDKFSDDIGYLVFLDAIFAALGVAFLILYFVGKKSLEQNQS